MWLFIIKMTLKLFVNIRMLCQLLALRRERKMAFGYVLIIFGNPRDSLCKYIGCFVS